MKSSRGTDPISLEPDKRMFRNGAQNETHRFVKRERQISFLYEALHFPKTGGTLTQHVGRKYPEKIILFPAALNAINIVKKRILGLLVTLTGKDALGLVLGFLLTPWRLKISLLDRFLKNECESADMVLDPIYLLKRFYTPAVQEFRTLIYVFLKELGFSKFVCSRLSDILANFLQFDLAYRYRFQDLMGSTSKQRLMEDPRREFRYLFSLYQQREQSAPARVVVYRKLSAIDKLLSVILLHPKVKRAIIKAVKVVDINKLALDDADRYHCLTASNYNYMGTAWSIRYNIYLAIHKGDLPPLMEVWV